MSEAADSGIRARQEVQPISNGLEKTEFRYGNAQELEALHPLALKFGKAAEVGSFLGTDPSAKKFLQEQGFGEELSCDRVTVKKISWGKEWYDDKDKPPDERAKSQPFDAPRAVYRMRVQSGDKRENVYVKVFFGNNETQENIAQFLEKESENGNKGIPKSAVAKIDGAVILMQKEVPGRSLKGKFKDLKATDNVEDAQAHLDNIAGWLADFHQDNSGVDNLVPSDTQAENADFARYAGKMKSLLSSDDPAREAFDLLEQSMPAIKDAANARSGTNYPSHTDFHPEHVYVTDDPTSLAVIDWDRAVKGSPAKDVAIFMNQMGAMGIDNIDGVDLGEYFLDQYKSHNPTADIDASLDVYRLHARLQTDKNLKQPGSDDIEGQAKFVRRTTKTKAFVKERISSLREKLSGSPDVDESMTAKIDNIIALV